MTDTTHINVHIDGKRTAITPDVGLRDLFAAHALVGVCHLVATGKHDLCLTRPSGAAGIAHSAYELADAMLKARGAK